jgi:hypothetical protein
MIVLTVWAWTTGAIVMEQFAWERRQPRLISRMLLWAIWPAVVTAAIVSITIDRWHHDDRHRH